MLKNTASGVPAPWPPSGAQQSLHSARCDKPSRSSRRARSRTPSYAPLAQQGLPYSRCTRQVTAFPLRASGQGWTGLFMHSLFYILIILGGPRADQNAKHFDYSTAPFETQLNAVGFCFFLQMGFQSTRNSQNSSYGHCRDPFPSTYRLKRGMLLNGSFV